MKQKNMPSEQELILSSLRRIQLQLFRAESAFEIVTDEALIDSLIFEIHSLHKQYEYWFKRAKALHMMVQQDLRIG